MAPDRLTRRSRSPRCSLVEREAELSRMSAGLEAARNGRGSSLLMEAPAGRGRSALLRAGGELAAAQGAVVLAARGRKLEREFAFGLAVELLDGSLLAPRAALEPPPARPLYETIHALFAALKAATASTGDGPRPAVLLVDDLQWADAESTRFLAYVGERVEALPVVLILALRSGETPVDPEALAALRRQAEHPLLQPAPFTLRGVRQILRGELPGAGEEFCRACHGLSAGNPFLLNGLLQELRSRGGAERWPPEDLGSPPATIRDWVAHRLSPITPEAHAVLRAVALIGQPAELLEAAQLSGLSEERTALAADELAALELLQKGSSLAFAQPLAQAAVLAELSPLALNRGRSRALQVLLDSGAEASRVAPLALSGEPHADSRVLSALREAARGALAHGGAAPAVALLEQAVLEDPAGATRAEVLGELGCAESSAGLLDAAACHLGEALEAVDEPGRAGLSLELASVLRKLERPAEAAEVVLARLEADQGRRLAQRRDLLSAFIGCAALTRTHGSTMVRYREELASRLKGGARPAERQAIALSLYRETAGGQTRAATRALCEMAWEDGALLREGGDADAGLIVLTGALVAADELERALEVAGQALDSHGGKLSPGSRTALLCLRSMASYLQGRLVQARHDARMALGRPLTRRPDHHHYGLALMATLEVEHNRSHRARTMLEILDRDGGFKGSVEPLLLEARARVQLECHHPEAALRDALAAGELLEARAEPSNLVTWRTTAALAHLALGEAEAAVRLASEDLRSARELDIPRLQIRAEHVLGLALGEAEGLRRLQAAVNLGAQVPQRLYYFHALVELGGALRRGNQRAEAKEVLLKALDLSHRHGCRWTAARARVELLAAGARPRRPVLSGLEALTGSERRVADLAAQGLTTRQISETLFITGKTVEFHLRNVYRKLGIESRPGLRDYIEVPQDEAPHARFTGFS